jgi:uncharacterized coiled-coil protein SlyX
MTKLCDECETVAHCLKHGCIPKQARALDKKAENARELGLDYEPPCKTGSQCTSKCQQCVVQEPDYKALWQQMCERCDELDKELSATDRQVEILSDALAESRREVAAPMQEPVAYLCENAVGHKYFRWKKPSSTFKPIALYTTPPAAQRQWVNLTDEEIDELVNRFARYELARAIEAKLKEKNA